MLNHLSILGTVSESLVKTYLSSLGYEVFGPDSSHSRADLVYLTEQRVVRVQVKTSSVFSRSLHRYEQCRVVRRGINRPYTEDEIDELWIVGTHLWCFPISLVKDLTSITLGSDNENPRKTVRTYDPDDFVVIRGHLDRPFKTRWLEDDPEPSHFETKTEYSARTAYAIRHKPGGDLYEKRMLKQAAGAPPRKAKTRK